MTSSLILPTDYANARRRLYQTYNVPAQPTPRRFLQTAISTLGAGATRLASAITSVPQRVDRAVSRATGIDLAWSSRILTLGSAASAFAYRGPVRSFAALHFHDRLGHLECFAAVNATIDSVRGANHRLKYGHTIFALPSLIHKHGLIAIPGYTLHVLQDFTTVAGVPLFPGARLAAVGLRKVGLSGSVATGLVTINLAGAITFVTAALALREVASIGVEVYQQIHRRRQTLHPATAATISERL